MMSLAPYNSPLPLNLIFNFSILSCKAWFSFWNWPILSYFVFIAFFNLSMPPFNPLIYPTFRLTFEIAWRSPLVLGSTSAVGGIATTMFSNFVCTYD
jgi:hypothetical protein